MVSFEVIALALFFSIVGIYLFIDRKNIQFNYGFIVRRWTRGLRLIDRFVKAYPRFITIFGNIGVVLVLIAGIGATILILISSVKLQSEARLILPTAGGYQIPGPVFSVPFFYWLPAIFIILATHETMHAVYSRLEKVPVRNYGIFMLLLLPLGAFVDPDNNKIKRLPTLKKMRIFAAGNLINFTLAALSFILIVVLSFLFVSTTTSYGVNVVSVAENSSAFDEGLSGAISAIGGEQVENINEFTEILSAAKPGDRMIITTDTGTYNITLGSNPQNQSKAYMGVVVTPAYFRYNVLGLQGILPTAAQAIFSTIISFLTWLGFLNLAVGTANSLPIKPFDGGLFFGEIFTKLFKERGNLIITVLSVLVIGLILFNLFGIPLIKNLIG